MQKKITATFADGDVRIRRTGRPYVSCWRAKRSDRATKYGFSHEPGDYAKEAQRYSAWGYTVDFATSVVAS